MDENLVKFINPYPLSGDGQGMVIDRKGSLLSVETEDGRLTVPISQVFDGEYPPDPHHDKLAPYARFAIPYLLNDKHPPEHQAKYENLGDYEQKEENIKEYYHAFKKLKEALPVGVWICFEYDNGLYGLMSVDKWKTGLEQHRELHLLPWSDELPSNVKMLKRNQQIQDKAWEIFDYIFDDQVAPGVIVVGTIIFLIIYYLYHYS